MHKEAKVKFIEHLCKFFLSFSLFCFFKISRDLEFELKKFKVYFPFILFRVLQVVLVKSVGVAALV